MVAGVRAQGLRIDQDTPHFRVCARKQTIRGPQLAANDGSDTGATQPENEIRCTSSLVRYRAVRAGCPGAQGECVGGKSTVRAICPRKV